MPDDERRIGTHTGWLLFSTDDLRVLQLLPREMSLAEIATAVGRRPPEVRTRAIGIYRQLGAVDRAEAVERAKSLGLVQ